jgi:hypothetical protein
MRSRAKVDAIWGSKKLKSAAGAPRQEDDQGLNRHCAPNAARSDAP